LAANTHRRTRCWDQAAAASNATIANSLIRVTIGAEHTRRTHRAASGLCPFDRDFCRSVLSCFRTDGDFRYSTVRLTREQGEKPMAQSGKVTVHTFSLHSTEDQPDQPVPDLYLILEKLLGNVTVGFNRCGAAADLQIEVRAGVDAAVGAGSYNLPQQTWQITDTADGLQRSLYVGVFQDSATTVLVQGRRIEIPAGHLLIATSGVPFTIIQKGQCRWQLIRVSAAAVQLPSDTIDRLVYHPFQLNSYLRKLIADVVPGPDQRRSTEPALIDVIGFDRYLAGLTEMILRCSMDSADDLLPSSAGRQEVERFIRRNLSDAQLSVRTVATANAVSRRRLYQIFAGAGIGVAEFIRRTRLEKALALLADPAYDSMAISQIAHEVGISSPAHFSRLFRQATGASPLEFRRKARGLRG